MKKITKKGISLLLSSTMILGTLPQSFAFDTAENSLEVFTPIEQETLTSASDFTFSNGEITEYTGTDTVVVIPSTIDGEPVISIGNTTFYNNKSIQTVIIPEGVTEIGDFSFKLCTSLSSVTFPSTVTNIGDSAFYSCSKLSIIQFPDALETIGPYAFSNCDSLSTVNFNEGLLNIGYRAFEGCYTLESVVFPGSLEGLGAASFSSCSSLKSVIINSGLTSILTATFARCGDLTFVSIPNTVTSLGLNSFQYCHSLEFFYIPSSITSIGEYSFNANNSASEEEAIRLENLIIQAVAGSYAETYAIEKGIPYVTVAEGYIPGKNEETGGHTHQTLTNATQYSSYYTKILNVSDASTLVSGSLPKGLGVYADGTIGGVPTQAGTFEFVVNTTMGEMPYTITVLENTAANVEADNDYEILQRIPTVADNSTAHIFEVDGSFDQFTNVYLNGTLLVDKVDYFAMSGSTKIVILADTLAQVVIPSMPHLNLWMSVITAVPVVLAVLLLPMSPWKKWHKPL